MIDLTNLTGCTLPTTDRPLRQAEFDELFGDIEALESPAATELVLHLRRDPEVIGRAATLAAKESQCCSFFGFRVTIDADQSSLAITTSGDHEQVLAAIADRARGFVSTAD